MTYARICRRAAVARDVDVRMSDILNGVPTQFDGFHARIRPGCEAALCYDAAMPIIEPSALIEDDWEWLAKMAARLTGPQVTPAALCCTRLWAHGFAKDQGDGRYSITTKGYKALRDRAAGI